MGFEILPWEEGDNEHFEIFEITQDKKWTPRRFQTSMDNSPPQGGPDLDRTPEEVDDDDVSLTGLTVANITLPDDKVVVPPLDAITLPVNVLENMAVSKDCAPDPDEEDDIPDHLSDLAVRETFDDDNSIVMEQDDDESTMPDLIYRAAKEGEEEDSDDDDFSLPGFCQREDDCT